MNIDERDKLRLISFREFADRWLDGLEREYDALGDAWIDTFRPEIASQMRALSERVDNLISLLTHLGTEETMEAFVAEFGHEKGGVTIPSYETLLPAIRALGGNGDDTALTVIGIFRYAKGSRGLGGTAGDNIRTD